MRATLTQVAEKKVSVWHSRGPLLAMLFCLWAHLATFQNAMAQSPGGAEGAASTTGGGESSGTGPSSTGEGESAEQELPSRWVVIELDAVENAAFYEIQIRSGAQAWREPTKIKIPAAEQAKARLVPGKYKIRTRTIDVSQKVGGWSSWKDFQVAFSSVTEATPKSGEQIIPKTSGVERITFEWPVVPMAQEYLFILKDQKGTVIKKSRTKQPWFTADTRPRFKYSWTARPIIKPEDMDAAPANEKFSEFDVTEPNQNARAVMIGLLPARKAVSYQFEVAKFIQPGVLGAPSVFSSREPEFRVSMAPGEYEMRVRSVYENKAVSDWSSPERFAILLPTAPLLAPSPNEFVRSEDDEKAQVNLKWQKIPEAGRYRVVVFNEKDEVIWQKDTKNTSEDAFLPAGKVYRWQVIAFNFTEGERGLAEADRERARPFRIEDYIKLELSKSEEPSQFYGWGKYIMSNATMVTANADYFNRINQKLFGGHLELAAGYWWRRKNLGYLASFETTGFSLVGQNVFHFSGGASLGYRFKLENGLRVRTWLGPSLRVLPEVQQDPGSNQMLFKRIKTLGPEVRVSVHGELGGDYGWQFLGMYYTGPMSLETPNGLKGETATSYSLGLHVARPIGEGRIGLLGYTYRSDKGAYPSTEAGLTNTVALEGHYLSLVIQQGLEPASK